MQICAAITQVHLKLLFILQHFQISFTILGCSSVQKNWFPFPNSSACFLICIVRNGINSWGLIPEGLLAYFWCAIKLLQREFIREHKVYHIVSSSNFRIWWQNPGDFVFIYTGSLRQVLGILVKIHGPIFANQGLDAHSYSCVVE